MQEESVYSYGDPLAFDKKNPWEARELWRGEFPGDRLSKVIPAKSRASAPAPAPAAATAAQPVPQQSWPMSSQAFEFAFTEDEIAASQDLKCAVCLETVVETDLEHVLLDDLGFFQTARTSFALSASAVGARAGYPIARAQRSLRAGQVQGRVESGFIVPSKYFVASKFRRFRPSATFTKRL